MGGRQGNIVILIYALEKSLGLLCSGWRVRGSMQSGRPVRTEIQMAGYDGLDLGCDKVVTGMWLELGLLGIRTDKCTERVRGREIKDTSWFLA